MFVYTTQKHKITVIVQSVVYSKEIYYNVHDSLMSRISKEMHKYCDISWNNTSKMKLVQFSKENVCYESKIEN